MTVIFARKQDGHTVFMADSHCSSNDIIYTSPNLKIEKVKQQQISAIPYSIYTFGVSGNYFISLLLQKFFSELSDYHIKGIEEACMFLKDFLDVLKKYNIDEPDSDALIAYKDKLFWADFDNPCILEIEEWWAIGSGSNYAIAADYCGKDMEESISVACALSPNCALPIQTVIHDWKS